MLNKRSNKVSVGLELWEILVIELHRLYGATEHFRRAETWRPSDDPQSELHQQTVMAAAAEQPPWSTDQRGLFSGTGTSKLLGTQRKSTVLQKKVFTEEWMEDVL